MASTGVLKHAPREGRPANQRENISISPHGANSPMKMVKVWGGEKKLFRPGIFPNVCAGDWSSCAHYTQMVWSTTTEVGCAFVEGQKFDALVCRYSPPGNQDNKPVLSALTRDHRSRSLPGDAEMRGGGSCAVIGNLRRCGSRTPLMKRAGTSLRSGSQYLDGSCFTPSASLRSASGKFGALPNSETFACRSASRRRCGLLGETASIANGMAGRTP